jgi:hypothetical protein
MKPTQVRNIDGAMLTLYPMQGRLQTELFKDKRLHRKTASSPYIIQTCKMEPAYWLDDAEVIKEEVEATGIYIVVVLPQAPHIAFVRRDPENRAHLRKESTNYERGHSSIAEGRSVIYAGELYFEKGQLTAWTRKTGHYHVGKALMGAAVVTHAREQTQFLKNAEDSGRLLPMESFQPTWLE